MWNVLTRRDPALHQKSISRPCQRKLVTAACMLSRPVCVSSGLSGSSAGKTYRISDDTYRITRCQASQTYRHARRQMHEATGENVSIPGSDHKMGSLLEKRIILIRWRCHVTRDEDRNDKRIDRDDSSHNDWYERLQRTFS